jgi:hypothetical protein
MRHISIPQMDDLKKGHQVPDLDYLDLDSYTENTKVAV